MRSWQRQWTTEAGFSLTELMVGMAVLLLLLGGIYAVMAAGQQSYYIGDSRIQVQQEARRALDGLARELRAASAATVVFNDGNANGLLDPGDSLVFNTVTGMAGGAPTLSTPIQYTVGGLNNQMLQRTQDGATRVTANDVQQFSIVATASMATLGITTQRTALPGQILNEQIQSQVAFRN